MKSLNSFFVLGIALIAQTAFAAEGGSTRGGGDIQCDSLIQNLIYQDPAGNLESWIKNGGPETGKLDLSSSLNPNSGKPYTYSEYDGAMLALINSFAKAPDVNCVRPGDKGYPVTVSNTEKICATSVDRNGVHMTCDRNLFMALTPDQQIEQTHHELAINVPGLEEDTGSISTYKISSQLADFVENVSVRRIVVKAPSANSGGTIPPSELQKITEALGNLLASKGQDCTMNGEKTLNPSINFYLIENANVGYRKTEDGKSILQLIASNTFDKRIYTVTLSSDEKVVTEVVYEFMPVEDVNEGTLSEPVIIRKPVLSAKYICEYPQ